MSLRTKSIPKIKKYPNSSKKKFKDLQQSLKKYEMKLWTHGFRETSPVRRTNNYLNTKTIRSRVSPLRKSKKKNTYSNISSSDSSLDTFGRISMFDSSETRTMGSPVIKIEKVRNDSIDYEAELESCRRQNLDLQTKIEKLQQKTLNTSKRNISIVKETERLIDYDESQVDKSDIEREFEYAHDKIMKKVKSKHQSQIKEIEESLTEKFQNDFIELEKLHEEKMQVKIKEITAEFERKLARGQEEIIWLRKQNEKHKRNEEEANSRLELMTAGKSDDFSNKVIEQNKKFLDMQKQFVQLQHDYLRVKKEGNLCQKCKAFTETNDEISSKIQRLRSFIESDNR